MSRPRADATLSTMPTPAERKALLFLAGVIVLGAGVRVVRAAREDASDDPASRQALSRQLAAVDSARRDDGAARRGRSSARGAGGRRRAARPAARSRTDSSSTVRPESAGRRARTRRDSAAVPAAPVDLDIASESEIETLPRIGPVLARRIVEDRVANGPFGSIAGFERVRGVGPALAASLGSGVTFSGTARPSNALTEQRLSSPQPSTKPPRKQRRN